MIYENTYANEKDYIWHFKIINKSIFVIFTQYINKSKRNEITLNKSVSKTRKIWTFYNT